MRRLASLVLALLLASPGSLAAEKGPTLLTVAGAIGQTNRGPLEPFRDALLVRLVDPFERAYAFDAAGLAALPQREISASFANWDGASHSFRGPAVADLLVSLEASGTAITFVALDGYSATFQRAEFEQGGFILATEMDGVPLELGGFGPTWLMVNPESAPAYAAAADDSGLVWGTVFILVE